MSNPQSETEWPAGLHIKGFDAVGKPPAYFIVFHGRKHICAFLDESAAECALKYWEGQMVVGMAPGEWTIPLAQACLNAILIARTEKAENGGTAAEERFAEHEKRLDAIRALVDKAASSDDLAEIKRHFADLRRLADRWSEGGSHGGDKSGEVRANKLWHIHGRDFIAKNRAKAKSKRNLAHKLEADLTIKGIEHPDLPQIEKWTAAQLRKANSRK
jgi:hypothetical protein